jgi:hypothetical protein
MNFTGDEESKEKGRGSYSSKDTPARSVYLRLVPPARRSLENPVYVNEDEPLLLIGES